MPAVVLSLAFYVAYDPVTPGALSPAVTTGLLRDALGFDGVAITDDLGAGAVRSGNSVPKAAVDALVAGADLVRVDAPEDQAGVREAIVAAVGDGTLPVERLQQAAARVLELKRARGLTAGCEAEAAGRSRGAPPLRRLVTAHTRSRLARYISAIHGLEPHRIRDPRDARQAADERLRHQVVRRPLDPVLLGGQLRADLPRAAAAGRRRPDRGRHRPRELAGADRVPAHRRRPRELERWLAATSEVYEMRDEYLLKLFFSDVAGPEAATARAGGQGGPPSGGRGRAPRDPGRGRPGRGERDRHDVAVRDRFSRLRRRLVRTRSKRSERDDGQSSTALADRERQAGGDPRGRLLRDRGRPRRGGGGPARPLRRRRPRHRERDRRRAPRGGRLSRDGSGGAGRRRRRRAPRPGARSATCAPSSSAIPMSPASRTSSAPARARSSRATATPPISR